jgi:hypothetical protein
MADPGTPEDPVPTWNLAQQGSQAGVTWSVFLGDSTKHLRCISLDLDPKPPSLSPPPQNLVDPLTGKSIPPPPLLETVASGGGRRHDGCAPAPSLTSMSSQPLHMLTAFQPEGPTVTYHYAAGTTAPEIGEVTAEFSDGTTAQVAASHGTFILIYPPSKKLAALRPLVAKFPELRCPIAELQIPAIPGGPPASTTYVDGGCTGYTGKFRPFG